MEKNIQKKLPSFQEFIQPPKVNEDNNIEDNNINIDVPWKNDIINSIIGELNISYGIKNITQLIKYVKERNKVLGIECSDQGSYLCLPFLKELVFMHSYGKMQQEEDKDPSREAVKATIVDNLAKEVLRLIEYHSASPIKISAPALPQDQNTAPMEADYEEYFDECRAIIGYEKFSSILERQTYMLNKDYHDKCLKFCLDAIKKAVGSLKFDDIVKKITGIGKVEIKDEKNLVKSYIFSKAMVFMDGKVNEGKKKESKPVRADYHQDQAALTKFCNLIVRDAMERIMKETKKYS